MRCLSPTYFEPSDRRSAAHSVLLNVDTMSDDDDDDAMHTGVYDS